MDEIEKIETLLDSHPEDQGLRLMLAELLAERGDDRAIGVRWMVHQGKFPARDSVFTAGVETWDWWSMLPGWNGGIGDSNDRTDRLDPALMRALDQHHRKSNWSNDCCYCEYRSRSEAEYALCRALNSVEKARRSRK
jgi:hypothetical protein